MAGTFVIRPTSLVSGGVPYALGSDITIPWLGYVQFTAGPLAPIIDVLRQTGPTDSIAATIFRTGAGSDTFLDTLRLAFTGASFYLDGSPTPIAFASLPSGFTPTAAAVKIGPSITPDNADDLYNLQQGVGVNGPDLTPTFDYDFSGIPPSALDIYVGGIGLKVFLSVTQAQGNFTEIGPLFDLRVEGTYEINDYSWDLEVPDDPVDTGTKIRVTSNSDDPTDPRVLDVDQITTITVTYKDSSDVWQEITVTNITLVYRRITISNIVNILEFTIPDILSIDPGDPPKTLLIRITSTQFSGSVVLGKLITIYFVDAPGIYRLVPSKHTDTLYDIENGGTVDVKIPNPFAKTGFVGN